MAGQRRTRLDARAMHSQLIAGAAAMLTVTTVAVSGVTTDSLHQHPGHLPVLADVQLTAFASPLLEIYDTIQKTNLYLFSIAEPPATTFDHAGLIPDFLGAGFPILTQYFLNAPDYVNQSLNYLFQDFLPPAPTPYITPYPGALRILTWAADALPANMGLAAQQLFSWDLVGALATLKFAIGNPVQAALYQTLNAGMYVLGGVGDRLAAVLTEVSSWVPTTIRNIADDFTVVMNAAADVVANVVIGIQNLDVQKVWNSLVVGLLGTSGDLAHPTIPDALINQTIGEGGRIYTVPGQPGYIEVPSFRQNQIELRDAIADALATDVPLPADPPFPVNPAPLPSQIPTPWQPTPVFAAPLMAASVVTPDVTDGRAGVLLSSDEGSTISSVGSDTLAGSHIADSSGEPELAGGHAAGPRAVRSTHDGRGAADRPAKQVGARSLSE